MKITSPRTIAKSHQEHTPRVALFDNARGVAKHGSRQGYLTRLVHRTLWGISHVLATYSPGAPVPGLMPRCRACSMTLLAGASRILTQTEFVVLETSLFETYTRSAAVLRCHRIHASKGASWRAISPDYCTGRSTMRSYKSTSPLFPCLAVAPGPFLCDSGVAGAPECSVSGRSKASIGS